MRRPFNWLCGVGIAAVVATTSVHAGWNEFWSRCHLDYHRNDAWPEPFSSADRQIVRQHWELTEANGWKLQNTLGDFLFHVDTHALNQAGERKVLWVMANTPIHRRQVFVLKADTEQHSMQRLASVQQFLSQVVADGQVPPVLFTDKDAPGIPGQYLQNVDEQYWKTQPPPRLPAATGGANAAAAGGS